MHASPSTIKRECGWVGGCGVSVSVYKNKVVQSRDGTSYQTGTSIVPNTNKTSDPLPAEILFVAYK